MQTQLHSQFGDAVGHWQGVTMVIETAIIITDSWLSKRGLFHTDKMRITERPRRVGNGIEYTGTIDNLVVLE